MTTWTSAPRLQEEILTAVDHQDHDQEYIDGCIHDLRKVIAVALGMSDVKDAVSQADYDFCTSVIRDKLMKAWAKKAQGPAAHIMEWFVTGAPAGISCTLWDEVDRDETPGDPAELYTDLRAYRNHGNVEEIKEVQELLEEYKKKRYIIIFRNIKDAEKYLKGGPVLRNILLIEKQKYDAKLKAMTTKLRTVLDLASSGVTDATELWYRTELPKATDAVANSLDMIHDCKGGQQVELVVADIQDAFWLIPY